MKKTRAGVANQSDYKRDLESFKQSQKSIAKYLCYNVMFPDVIEQIDLAQSESEIIRIMTNCREHS